MLAELILVFAAAVLVPLAISSPPTLLSRPRWMLVVIAALLLAASFAWPQGWLAAALALPWLTVTAAVAISGVRRLIGHGWHFDAHSARQFGRVYLLVGGSWAVLSRFGAQPQDFSHEIVLLTAVHFHYAGFLLPTIAAGVVEQLSTARGEASGGPLSFVDRILLAAIVIGVPLVGVGISLSPTIEIVAATVLVAGCWLLAGRQLQLAFGTRNPNRLTLLAISALSLAAAMALAVMYALGEFLGQPWLTIPQMIPTHGAFNALGFAACGVFGLRMPSGVQVRSGDAVNGPLSSPR
jgi:hypothetical protein